jgi:hypothetical protein
MFGGVTNISPTQLGALSDNSSDHIGGVTFNSFDMIEEFLSTPPLFALKTYGELFR